MGAVSSGDLLPDRSIDLRGRAFRFASLRLESIELFPEGLAVRWKDVASSTWPEPDPPIALAAGRISGLRIEDDADTKYEPAGGGTTSDSVEQWGQSNFKPAPPPEATQLRLAAPDGQQLVVPL